MLTSMMCVQTQGGGGTGILTIGNKKYVYGYHSRDNIGSIAGNTQNLKELTYDYFFSTFVLEFNTKLNGEDVLVEINDMHILFSGEKDFAGGSYTKDVSGENDVQVATFLKNNVGQRVQYKISFPKK